jgi:hypothetical protein
MSAGMSFTSRNDEAITCLARQGTAFSWRDRTICACAARWLRYEVKTGGESIAVEGRALKGVAEALGRSPRAARASIPV